MNTNINANVNVNDHAQTTAARTQHAQATPERADIALLPAFERLPMACITTVTNGAQAQHAQQQLMQASAWGFDTESKPTFRVGETSDGPHVLQLALAHHAWVFQLSDPHCTAVAAQLLAHPGIVKAGFGLGDDTKRIVRKLGIAPQGITDLNAVFRQRGYRKEIGVKAAVAVLFGQQFAKSKKAATSNWAAAQLSPSQLLYAANDAYAALRVWQALQAP